MPTVLVLNGPNVNLLGSRKPRLYGSETVEAIVERISRQAEKAGVAPSAFQSNAEHELIDRIQRAPSEGVGFIITNPAGLTHTKYRQRPCSEAISTPLLPVRHSPRGNRRTRIARLRLRAGRHAATFATGITTQWTSARSNV